MKKAVFVSKPANLDWVKYGEERLISRFATRTLVSYYVAQEVQLKETEFFDLQDDLLAERWWVGTFSNRRHPMKDGAVPVIRVTCKGSLTVLLIDPQGHDYPRYVALEYEE